MGEDKITLKFTVFQDWKSEIDKILELRQRIKEKHPDISVIIKVQLN